MSEYMDILWTSLNVEECVLGFSVKIPVFELKTYWYESETQKSFQ